MSVQFRGQGSGQRWGQRSEFGGEWRVEGGGWQKTEVDLEEDED